MTLPFLPSEQNSLADTRGNDYATDKLQMMMMMMIMNIMLRLHIRRHNRLYRLFVVYVAEVDAHPQGIRVSRNSWLPLQLTD